MSRPLTLPRLAATEAQALGRLARHVLELPVASWAELRSPSPAPRLSLLHLAFGSSPLNPEDAVRARIEWSGCRLALDVPRASAEDWAQAVMGDSAAVTMPGPWRTYVLERALQWVMDSLSACGKGTARVVEAGLMASGPVEGTRHRFILSLDFAEPAVAVHAVLHCDNLGLLMLAGLLPADSKAVQGPIRLSDVPVRVYFSLGCTDLALSQWRAMQPGDVLFIQHPFFDGPETLALRVQVPSGPSWRLTARRDGLTLTVTSEAIAMSNSTEQPDDEAVAFGAAPISGDQDSTSATAVALGRLMVRLSFDVGHKDISMDELGALQPGEVLKLDRPIGEIVTVRANGAAVGSGTLVEIDGRVGVLLTAVATGGTP